VRRPRGWRLPPGRLGRRNGLAALALAVVLACFCTARETHKNDGQGSGPRQDSGESRSTGGRGAQRAEISFAPGRVARVEDGDTIALSDGRTVRYLGVDSPERDEPFHDEAAAANRRLVEGSQVELRAGGRDAADDYGRVLAIVTTGGGAVCVNVALVREGLASVYIVDPEAIRRDFLNELLRAQGLALSERRGLWGRVLETARNLREPLVATRLRIHRRSCPDSSRARPVPVMSLEEELKRGKSLCRSCRPLRN